MPRPGLRVHRGLLCAALVFPVACALIGGPPGHPVGVAEAQEAQKGRLPAAKKSKEGKEVPAVAPADPAEMLATQLRGPEAQALEAAQKLADLGTSKAVELTLNELALGVPPKVAALLLTGVDKKGSPQAFDILAIYSTDRNPELRKLAFTALGDLKDQRAVPLLISALADATPDVRAAAAQALGARKEKTAEPALLKLLAHKDTSAPAALAQVGGPDTARTLSEMVGNVPDRLVVEALGDFLKRKDFGPDPIRLEVVKTLGKIPGSDALDALSDYLKATAKDKALPSRTEASKIIEQRTAK